MRKLQVGLSPTGMFIEPEGGYMGISYSWMCTYEYVNMIYVNESCSEESKRKRSLRSGVK